MKEAEVFELIEAHYRKHSKTLVKKLTKLASSIQDAEDIVQDAYTWCLANWNKYDPDRGTVEVWFSSPLRHSIRSKLRDQHTNGVTDTPLEFYMRSISI